PSQRRAQTAVRAVHHVLRGNDGVAGPARLAGAAARLVAIGWLAARSLLAGATPGLAMVAKAATAEMAALAPRRCRARSGARDDRTDRGGRLHGGDRVRLYRPHRPGQLHKRSPRERHDESRDGWLL